mgnify:CR=1 FL=1
MRRTLSRAIGNVAARAAVDAEPGEAAEFDTRVPHWFGSTGEGPVEFLSLFGPQGERMHVRARPAAKGGKTE